MIAGLFFTVVVVPPTEWVLAAPAEKGRLRMQSIDNARWRFGGEIGRRVEANVENWLLRAPDANPGLIEMFRRRDRHLPYQEPVPWAGEFAGKYLISAVQACRMVETPGLKEYVAAFVKGLVRIQAADGYLGPWPKEQRLLGHWDLWGHYHCMLGLLMWYDLTGDRSAYDCAVRAADCICDIYVDAGRRPVQAGAPQINLAVLHVLANLYRRTGTERYMTLMRRIEEDMQTDGDWLRQGIKGVPYCKLPGGGTRWESLHIVQGLVELYRITGEERYRRAVVNLWKSLRDFDRHPSGAFSTRESAHGTVYEKGSIETCCSVAWEALTLDVLKLTGDSTVADELELTTWNQVLGAQHPSGSWWTYDTPMDGVRIPSFHHINFQYRPGTPELNCCSVNAPRGLGMLSEWAVMEQGSNIAVNFYGSGEFKLVRGKGEALTVRQETQYPVGADVTLEVTPEQPSEFTIRLRIPAWSKDTTVTLNRQGTDPAPEAGTYLDITRVWRKGDEIQLTFDMSPRFWSGQGQRHAHAALYAGPLLLAFDAFYNDVETAEVPPIDMEKVELTPLPVARERTPGHFPPLGLWRCQADDGTDLVLCDFASAGAHGTDYLAWLPAAHVPPPAVRLSLPEDNAVGAPGPVLFSWERTGKPEYELQLLVARDPDFNEIVVRRKGIDGNYVIIEPGLQQDGAYSWKVLAVNEAGTTESEGGARVIRIDSNREQQLLPVREDGLMVASALDGDGTPIFGVCRHQQELTSAADRAGKKDAAVAFDGAASELRYTLAFFPEAEYSFAAWICPEGLPTQGLQQVFSAWCKGGDDPLRVTLEGARLFARIENPKGGCSTRGVPLENGRWVHVAAVKDADRLTLYVNGVPADTVGTHARIRSDSRAVGIGFNPLFSGGEHFSGKVDDFAFYAGALSVEEIAKMCR
jgi:hypothetical protein